MFARRDRLTRAAFAARAPAKRLVSPHFGALMLEGHGYAVVIPKKVLRSSVARHRLKRQVLAALRLPPPLPLPSALILYPKTSALELSVKEMRAELASLLSKSRVIP